MNRIDLADPAAGVLATFDRHQPLAVFERNGVEGEVSFELETEVNGCRLELSGETAVGHWSVEALALRGRLRAADGSTTPIEAIGARSQGEPAPAPDPGADPAGLRRSIVICLEDGGLLGIFAARPRDAGEHDQEQLTGALASPDGVVTEFAEVRLSTEYGSDGAQRRATLELWPADGGAQGPLRAAGLAIAGTSLELPGARSKLAFFEWSVGGSPAVGRYEIIRAL